MGNPKIKAASIDIMHRLSLIDLDKEIKRDFIKDFVRFIDKNGIEWTIKRYKNILLTITKTTFEDNFDCSQIPDFYIRKKGDRLLGLYGKLQRHAKTSNHNFQQVCLLLKIVSIFKYEEWTSKRIREYCDTLVEPFNGSRNELDELIQSIQKVPNYLAFDGYLKFKHDISHNKPYLLREPHSRKKVEFDFYHTADIQLRTDGMIKLRKKFPNATECLFSVDTQPNAKNVRTEHRKFNLAAKLLDTATQQTLSFNRDTQVRNFKEYLPVGIGEIHCLAFPALKDRVVCAFNKLLEHCVHPIGKRVYSIVKDLPWDITFDEEKCYMPIRYHLYKGQKCYCFDLTAATDRFPWELQYELLKSFNFGPNFTEQVELFNYIVKQKAYLPDRSTVHWEVGQPMGSYPSFAFFTLAHGCLLYALNGYKFDYKFFIHGDDVVICCDILAKKYAKALKSLGIKSNDYKALHSNKAAEINSKIITIDDVLVMPKWQEAKDENILDLIPIWGTKILKEVPRLRRSSKQREAIETFCSLPQPLGYGMNPKGLSLDYRLDCFSQLFDKVEKESNQYSLSAKTYARARLSHILGNNAYSATSQEAALRQYLGILDIAEALDQRALREYASLPSTSKHLLKHLLQMAHFSKNQSEFRSASFSCESLRNLILPQFYEINDALDISISAKPQDIVDTSAIDLLPEIVPLPVDKRISDYVLNDIKKIGQIYLLNVHTLSLYPVVYNYDYMDRATPQLGLRSLPRKQYTTVASAFLKDPIKIKDVKIN